MKKALFVMSALAIAGGTMFGVLSAKATAVDATTNENANTNKVNGNSNSAGSTAFNIACIAAAVDKRENSVITAVDTFTSSWKTALSARRDALKAAWALTDKKARNKAINTAWNTYNTAKWNARKVYNTARMAGWKTYRADRKACGKVTDSSAKISDGHESGNDIL